MARSRPRQVDEKHALERDGRRSLADLDGEAGLATTPWPYQADQPVLCSVSRHLTISIVEARPTKFVS